MVKQYQQVFQNPPHQCVYNIVVDKQSRERIKESVDHPWLLEKNEPVLVAAGRLELWKGFGDLIDAVAIVRKSRSVKLLVLGDGPLRADLQRSIDTYNMTDSVDLVGYVENPLKYFRHSDVFVLASHVEGLPNVLVEAMMCGCTPVATDCPTGPREVLQGEKYGYLVPVRDPVLMAAAIQRAIDNPISSALLEEAVEAFEESRVIRRHFELLGLCAESYI
jgi:glycosyltransferase involved in cell wall biosynthesis